MGICAGMKKTTWHEEKETWHLLELTDKCTSDAAEEDFHSQINCML